MQKTKIMKNKKTGIALSATFALVMTIVFVQYYPVNTQTFSSETSSDESISYVPLPPPILLKDIGIQSTSFNEAKSQAGLSQAFTPLYVPGDLVLDSTRLILDSNGNRMVIIYLPNGDKSTADTSIREVIDKGMAIEISRELDDANFNWNNFVTQSVKENSNIRSSSQMNNHQILLIKNNPEIDYPNMAKTMVGNLRIEIASDQYDVTQLEKVIKSIMTQ
jgi:hypothetical protein